ncbi:MAG: hypothetical protein Ct9H300mP1_15170 [Planctomycetaceae bacterium]|nr:MAG: hypothetical protein Ct9H300mP1_15170 [Planctomycetaceae bacterium]
MTSTVVTRLARCWCHPAGDRCGTGPTRTDGPGQPAPVRHTPPRQHRFRPFESGSGTPVRTGIRGIAAVCRMPRHQHATGAKTAHSRAMSRGTPKTNHRPKFPMTRADGLRGGPGGIPAAPPESLVLQGRHPCATGRSSSITCRVRPFSRNPPCRTRWNPRRVPPHVVRTAEGLGHVTGLRPHDPRFVSPPCHTRLPDVSRRPGRTPPAPGFHVSAQRTSLAANAVTDRGLFTRRHAGKVPKRPRAPGPATPRIPPIVHPRAHLDRPWPRRSVSSATCRET